MSKVHKLAGLHGLTKCGLHADKQRNTIKATKQTFNVTCEKCLKSIYNMVPPLDHLAAMKIVNKVRKKLKQKEGA